LGSEQVVRAHNVELLDHRRSVRQILELLQEPRVLGDRRPGVLDAVSQLDQGNECRAVHHPRRRVAQTLGTDAIKRREQVARRRRGLIDAPVLDLLAHHHHAHLIFLPLGRRAAALSQRPWLAGHMDDDPRPRNVTGAAPSSARLTGSPGYADAMSTAARSSRRRRAGSPMTSIAVMRSPSIVTSRTRSSRPRGATTIPITPLTRAGLANRARPALVSAASATRRAPR